MCRFRKQWFVSSKKTMPTTDRILNRFVWSAPAPARRDRPGFLSLEFFPCVPKKWPGNHCSFCCCALRGLDRARLSILFGNGLIEIAVFSPVTKDKSIRISKDPPFFLIHQMLAFHVPIPMAAVIEMDTTFE